MILFITIQFQISSGISFDVQSLLLKVLLLGEQVLVDNKIGKASENFQNSDYWSEVGIKCYHFVPSKRVLFGMVLHFP